jgi:PKD repeat protein
MTKNFYVFMMSLIAICLIVSSFPIDTLSKAGEEIDTSVDEIIPYEQTNPQLTITATGPSDLDNVSVFYRYDTLNFTTDPLKHLQKIEETAVFRDGVDTTTLNYPNQLITQDGIVYIISTYDHAITIVDATNSSHPVELSHIVDTTYLYYGHDIGLTDDGKYAYTVNYGKKNSLLSMWNTTDKTSIIRMDSIMISSEKGMYIDIDSEDNYLYLTTNLSLYIFNITDKSINQMDMMKKIPNDTRHKYINWHPTIYGDTLYVGCRNVSHNSTGYGISVYNVADKTNPYQVNAINSTAQICEANVYQHTNGFTYLIFTGYIFATYYRGYIWAYNISAGNASHPVFMYCLHIEDSHGNMTDGLIAMTNGYGFIGSNNYNHTNIRSGFWVFNFTNIEQPPTFVTRMSGRGAPNYLNLCHEIAKDENGSNNTIYILSQNDDALVIVTPAWLPTAWTRYDIPDASAPWSWLFDYPNGDGYYELYSIGQKTGETPESPPLESDAMVHYTNLSPQVDFSYTPEQPTTDDVIRFSDTSVIHEGWILAWTWDFGDGNISSSQNTTHQFSQAGVYLVSLTITDNGNNQHTASKVIQVKEPPVFFKSIIFGRITNVNTDGMYITFNAINTNIIYFNPMYVVDFTHGEEFMISKNYVGFIGARVILAACDTSVEIE